MTKDQKDKMLNVLVEDRNEYVRACEKRITIEQGKIVGANYMFQRFHDILSKAVEPQERSNEWVNFAEDLIPIMDEQI